MGHTDLSDKRIVISGAAGRLGSRMVRQFSEWGADVVALVRSAGEASRLEATGQVVAAEAVDATSETAVVECFRAIRSDLGEIDALVHTIGMWSGGPLLETSFQEWDTILRVNLTSAFLCFREAARVMKPGGGTLIGISARQGADGGVAEQPAYSAAKAGVVRLVESVAREFSEKNLACHAIAPSTVLYEEVGDGVQAADLIEMAAFLIGHGRSLSGATIRTYGD